MLAFQILRRGANVNDRDGMTGLSLLHYACKSGAGKKVGKGSPWQHVCNHVVRAVAFEFVIRAISTVYVRHRKVWLVRGKVCLIVGKPSVGHPGIWRVLERNANTDLGRWPGLLMGQNRNFV